MQDLTLNDEMQMPDMPNLIMMDLPDKNVHVC